MCSGVHVFMEDSTCVSTTKSLGAYGLKVLEGHLYIQLHGAETNCMLMAWGSSNRVETSYLKKPRGIYFTQNSCKTQALK